MATLSILALFAAAALAEIAGCFAVWAWMQQGASVLCLVRGLAALAAYAWLLPLTPSDFAGRMFADYGRRLYCRFARLAVGCRGPAA